jgi:hypothetical protein
VFGLTSGEAMGVPKAAIGKRIRAMLASFILLVNQLV